MHIGISRTGKQPMEHHHETPTLRGGLRRHTRLAAACSPEAPKPTSPRRRRAPTVADPAVTSIAMAADPAALGFDAAIFDKAKADLEADVKSGTIPGAVLLVAKGGQVVNVTTVGSRRPGRTQTR